MSSKYSNSGGPSSGGPNTRHHNAEQLGYIDSSVILRIILNEPFAKFDLNLFSQIFTCRITQIECYRVLNRQFLEKKMNAESSAAAIQRLRFIMKGFKVIQVHERILKLAESSWSTPIATLDGIHLAAALHIQDAIKTNEITFVTHDYQQARGAQSLGLPTQGID